VWRCRGNDDISDDITDLVFVVDAVERVVMRFAGRPTDTAAVGLLVVLTVPSSVGADTVHTAEKLLDKNAAQCEELSRKQVD